MCAIVDDLAASFFTKASDPIPDAGFVEFEDGENHAATRLHRACSRKQVTDGQGAMRAKSFVPLQVRTLVLGIFLHVHCVDLSCLGSVTQGPWLQFCKPWLGWPAES